MGTLRDIADYIESTSVTTIANHRTINSFGKLISETNTSVDLIYAYTGKQSDDATGLQHNLFRWLDPSLGRWLNEDPLSFAAGDENIRRYVGNVATLYTDPNGLEYYDPSYYYGLASILYFVGSMQQAYTAALLDVQSMVTSDSNLARSLAAEAQRQYAEAYSRGIFGQTNSAYERQQSWENYIIWYGTRMSIATSVLATSGYFLAYAGSSTASYMGSKPIEHGLYFARAQGRRLPHAYYNIGGNFYHGMQPLIPSSLVRLMIQQMTAKQ